jgi:hypothetical protein
MTKSLNLFGIACIEDILDGFERMKKRKSEFMASGQKRDIDCP